MSNLATAASMVPTGKTETATPFNSFNASTTRSESLIISFTPSLTTAHVQGDASARLSTSASYLNGSTLASTTSTLSSASTQILFATDAALSTTGPHVSSGVAAAIGAASAVGGALLASLVALLVLRRRRRKEPKRELSETTAVSSRLSLPLEKPHQDLSGLHPAVSTPDVANEFANLKTSIRDHVHWYYEPSDLSPLALQEHFSHHQETLKDLTGQPTLPSFSNHLPFLRTLITHTLLHSISPSSLINLTLLPPEILRCIEILPPSHLPHWRQKVSALFQPIYNSTPGHLDARDPRNENIGEVVALLCQILQPFVKKGLGTARVKDLERVVTQGAQFGWGLFGEGGDWEFDWESEGEGMVVWPALVRMVGGERVVVSPAEVMQM